eukprot:scaffold1799_cov96-Cylindrotheca_fusiformis.AAC.1
MSITALVSRKVPGGSCGATGKLLSLFAVDSGDCVNGVPSAWAKCFWFRSRRACSSSARVSTMTVVVRGRGFPVCGSTAPWSVWEVTLTAVRGGGRDDWNVCLILEKVRFDFSWASRHFSAASSSARGDENFRRAIRFRSCSRNCKRCSCAS